MHSKKILLDYGIEHGIIDMAKIASIYDNMEKLFYLKKHYGEDFTLEKLKPGNDHRYFTRLPNGKQVRKTDENAFINVIVDYYKANETLADGIKRIFDDWLAYQTKYAKISQGTVNRYESDFKRFFTNNAYAEDILKKPLSEIQEDELEFFIRDSIDLFELNNKGWLKLKALIKNIWLYGLKTKKTDLYIVRFLDTLFISSKVLKPDVENNEEQVFTDEEVRLIFDYIKNHPFSMVSMGILLAFYTGLRVGEIAALRWADISSDFTFITVQSEEVTYKDSEGIRHFEVVPHTKTKAGLRKVTLPEEGSMFLKELFKVCGENEFVFVNNNHRIQGRVFSDKLSKICGHLGITPRRIHKARKTVCSKLCDALVDDRLLLGQVGHTDRKTTEAFYHRDRRTIQEKIAIINNAINYYENDVQKNSASV